MLMKKKFEKFINISYYQPTVVKLCKDIGFTIEPPPREESSVFQLNGYIEDFEEGYIMSGSEKRKIMDESNFFQIKDCFGDFKIIGIYVSDYSGGSSKLDYDENGKKFKYNDKHRTSLKFVVEGMVEYKKVEYVKVPYELYISSERMEMLDLYDYYENEIILPGYEYLKFKYYIKRHENYVAEIHIENPYDLKIEGNRGDYKCETNMLQNFKKVLGFVFEPSNFTHGIQSAQELESRPDSVAELL